jgi:dATP pyrophosphohydrolase
VNARYDMISVFVVRPDASGAAHEFLQLRRSKDDFMGATWQTVRGTAEAGELAWQAALRELKEETGLVPDEFYKLSTLESFYVVKDETVWHCPGFVAMVSREAKVVLNDEHDAARWIARCEIDAAFMWPTERALLQEICREILDAGPSKPYVRIDLP